MAFAKGNASTEGAVRKLYKGVGSFYVLGVNPNKEEQEKFFGTSSDKEPEYLGEQDGVKNVRISFVIKSDGEKHKDNEGNPIELVTNHTFFLRNEARKGSNSGKYQIVDAYGNFAWADEETIKNKQIPQYSNGPANIHSNYRLAWVGEQQLTEFLMKYMCIPSCLKWADGKVVGWADNLEDCECRLDSIKEYFKGDFSELKTILSYQPNNKVKIPVGVKTTNDGKQYQSTYTETALNNAVKAYGKLDAEIKTRMASSSNPVDFTGDGNKSPIEDLSEYVVIPTSFESSSEVPFPASDNNDLPFNAF